VIITRPAWLAVFTSVTSCSARGMSPVAA
jgi:hypothetical protein